MWVPLTKEYLDSSRPTMTDCFKERLTDEIVELSGIPIILRSMAEAIGPSHNVGCHRA